MENVGPVCLFRGAYAERFRGDEPTLSVRVTSERGLPARQYDGHPPAQQGRAPVNNLLYSVHGCAREWGNAAVQALLSFRTWTNGNFRRQRTSQQFPAWAS